MRLFCPHHLHMGYEGEIKALKIDSDCPKPKLRILLKTAEDFNIDLIQSWMIGNGENDIMAGKTAGCGTVLIGKDDFGQAMNGQSLLEIVGNILAQ